MSLVSPFPLVLSQQLKRLVEQVSAPLSALRTLGYFLQDRMRPQEEAAQDLVDNLVIQGDRLQEVAEQLQVRCCAQGVHVHPRGWGEGYGLESRHLES